MNINDKYHANTKIQKKIIGSDNFTYRIILKIINKYAKHNAHVLDMGCGVGTIDFYLASKGCVVTGFDASKIAILIARRNAQALGFNDKTNFVCKKIPLKLNNKYDLILMIEIIEHLKNDQLVLNNAYRLLEKGGVLILFTRSLAAPLNRLHLSRWHDKRVGHLRRYKLSDLEIMLANMGFKIIEKKETEGILSDFLFSFPKFGTLIVKIANRFGLISKLLGCLDNLLCNLLGGSQILLVVSK